MNARNPGTDQISGTAEGTSGSSEGAAVAAEFTVTTSDN
jgi:hypothetical protein